MISPTAILVCERHPLEKRRETETVILYFSKGLGCWLSIVDIPIDCYRLFAARMQKAIE